MIAQWLLKNERKDKSKHFSKLTRSLQQNSYRIWFPKSQLEKKPNFIFATEAHLGSGELLRAASLIF